jgi:hypothetical protein
MEKYNGKVQTLAQPVSTAQTMAGHNRILLMHLNPHRAKTFRVATICLLNAAEQVCGNSTAISFAQMAP